MTTIRDHAETVKQMGNDGRMIGTVEASGAVLGVATAALRCSSCTAAQTLGVLSALVRSLATWNG